MSFFKNLKRAFGYSDTLEEDDDLLEREDGKSMRHPHEPEPKLTVEPKPDSPEPEESQTAPNLRLAKEVERLSAALAKVTSERDSARQLQLSAERQKRALSDRIHDLDQQLITLEQERDKLFEENRRLEVRSKTTAPVTPQASVPATGAESDEVAALRDELRRRDDTIAALNTELADEKRNSSVLKRDLDTLAVKSKMAETMVADLTAKAASANRELKKSQSELEEANKTIDVANEALSKLDLLAENKRKTDLRLAELQRAVAVKDKEIRSLNSTIEHNLRMHAEKQDLMKREIEALRNGLTLPEPRKDSAVADERSQRDQRRKQPPSTSDDGQLSLF